MLNYIKPSTVYNVTYWKDDCPLIGLKQTKARQYNGLLQKVDAAKGRNGASPRITHPPLSDHAFFTFPGILLIFRSLSRKDPFRKDGVPPMPTLFSEQVLLSDDGQSLGWRAYVILVLLSLTFFIPGLWTLPPVDRDEPRFAQATKQMIETGNYVDIRFQNEVRYKKPVGIYWLQAASVKIFNPHHLDEIWAYRLPSQVGATVAVVMTAAIGSLLFSPLTGFLAALMLAASLLLNTEARLAKTDAVLLACVTVAQYTLARAYRDRTSFATASAFWTAQAIGFLVKGPIVLLITLATLGYLRVTEKRLGWFKSLRPWIGLPYALLLTVPWFAAILMTSHGHFMAESAGHDMLAKIWQGQNHGIVPPGMHLLIFPLMFFPGSLIAMLALPGVWQNRRDSAVRFCLGWILVPWIVFELSLTKLPHYVLPVYPAIAILAADMLAKGFPGAVEKRWRWLTITAFIAWLIAGMALAIGITLLPWISEQQGEPAALMTGFILLATVGTTIVNLSGSTMKSFRLMIAGTLLATFLAFGLVIPMLGSFWLTRQVVQVAQHVKSCDKLEIASAAYREPSLVFLAGTGTVFTEYGEGVADRMRNNPCLLGLIDADHDQAFRDKFTYSADKPVPLAHFTGPNLGKGKTAHLTLYRLWKP